MLFVFDLDDTLYLERDFVKSGYRAVDVFLTSEKSLDGFFDFAWNEFQNGNFSYVINRFLEKSDCCTTEVLQSAIRVYRDHRPSITLLPDALDFLKQKPFDCFAMITDGYSMTQWNKITALGLPSMIKKIVVTGDWGKDYWKPHPRAYLEVQRDYPANQCVYIADNPRKDFCVPLELQWHPSVRIRRSGSLHYALPTDEHCIEIHSLTELCSLF